jgi:hypothetical protein
MTCKTKVIATRLFGGTLGVAVIGRCLVAAGVALPGAVMAAVFLSARPQQPKTVNQVVLDESQGAAEVPLAS